MGLPESMGIHYICKGGCGGVSEIPGACQAADCADYQKPLGECGCTDGLHGQIKEGDPTENSSEAKEPSL